MYNIYFYIIISFLVIFTAFDKIVDCLNTKNWSDKLPDELKEIYDEEKYKKAQNYDKAKNKLSNISSIFTFVITFLVFIFWWFWFLDNILRQYFQNEIILALVFFAVIFLIQTIISLPFSYYSTFVIEEKFWFNKMTKKLFYLDLLKWILLTFVIGWILWGLIIWIYTLIPNTFWLVAWLILSAFSLFIMMFYSSLIVPLFNKQTPLEDGELRQAINEFSKKAWFKLDNIYVIDGSKRSSKANAYFSGFWPKKRIVLFDTLIKDLETEELVAVLAHEIWHYKKKHTLQMLVFSILQTWFILFLFSFMLKNDEISLALWASQNSFHIWAIAFWILFTPLSLILGILANIFSRKNEFEADNYAKVNYSWEKLVSALKKLSNNNLSNLTPHWFYEFVHYSHPTVLKRIRELRK